MGKKSAHLTYDDRVRIETLLGEGASLRYITDRLDKAPSTISREIRKHTQLKPVHKCYTACVCFGISAFIHRGELGIGLGVAALFYFLNIIANLTEDVKFLKYITPFGYTASSDIIAQGKINVGYLSVGMLLLVIGVVVGFYQYYRKNIT